MRRSAAFTLIESIIVFTLVAIMLVGMTAIITTLMRSYILISGRDAAAGKARSAMNRMLSEIRLARKPQNITTYTTPEIQFLYFNNQTQSVEAVDFKQTGSTLYRNSATLETGLMTPTGLRFTYLGATGEVTTVKNDIRAVRIWLYMSAGTEQITLESAARIRTL